MAKKQSKGLYIGVIEGGVLNSIFLLKDGKPQGVEFAVLDWDHMKNDTAEFWQNLVPDVQDYIKNNLPDKWKSIQEGLKVQGVQL